MKYALVIGAGNFGRHLIRELLDNECRVDVLEKDSDVANRLNGMTCRVIHNNAWNIASIPSLDIPSYDCCYLCIGPNIGMMERAIRGLRQQGARRIVVRSVRASDIPRCREAGADQVICPPQYVGNMLAQELAGTAVQG